MSNGRSDGCSCRAKPAGPEPCQPYCPSTCALAGAGATRQKRPKLTEQEIRDRKTAAQRAKRAAKAALLPPKPAPLTDAERKERARLRVAAARQLKREQPAQQQRILEDNT